MILSQLKAQFRTAEPVAQEFVAFMETTFARYRETAESLFAALPGRLAQSELATLLGGEIKGRLFDAPFCESIQESLKTLRRAIIRLEDLRAAHPDLPGYVNDLGALVALAEQVEALYQRHWEFYRYQSRVTEAEVAQFLLEVARIGAGWEQYTGGLRAMRALVEVLRGRPLAEGWAALTLTYQRPPPEHFAAATLTAITEFLDAAYRFVCAVTALDPQRQPLTLLQVDIAEPVELHVAVPQGAEVAYARFLQYLFLKDLFKREPLLRIVFEAVERDFARERLSPAALANHQKELIAQLRRLPADGRFVVAGRAFPEDGIPVMREFIDELEQKQINYDALTGLEKPKAKGRAKAAQPSLPDPESPPAQATARAPRTKEHIPLLTERAF